MSGANLFKDRIDANKLFTKIVKVTIKDLFILMKLFIVTAQILIFH
jgi:hypothetical protein